MSRENVGIVRRATEARNRRDVDAVVRDVHPDLEFDWSESRAAAGRVIPAVLRGREQLRRQLSELLDVWENVTWELRDVVEVGTDQVLEVSHVRFSGRDGIELDDEGAFLWTFRGGKAIRMKFFPSKERALEAVGLSGQVVSRENLEVVKSLFSAFADRDLDAAATVLHPEVEIRPAVVGGPEGVVYRGLNGNRQFWADIDAAWTGFRIEAEEFRDLGGQVLVLGRALAHAPGSGIALNEASAWIAEVRDGQIVRFRSFSNQREALEAAGLHE